MGRHAMPDSWADIITNTWSVRTKTVGINMMWLVRINEIIEVGPNKIFVSKVLALFSRCLRVID